MVAREADDRHSMPEENKCKCNNVYSTPKKGGKQRSYPSGYRFKRKTKQAVNKRNERNERNKGVGTRWMTKPT